MTSNTVSRQESIDTRRLRSLWEAFDFSVPKPGLVSVQNHSKAEPSEYRVTVKGGAASSCSCPDWEHREPEGGCKHMRAVEAHGAVTRAAGKRDDQSLSTDRPADCDCLATFEGLSCWPCFSAGFDTPNPRAEEA